MRHDAATGAPPPGDIATATPRQMGAAALGLLHKIREGIDKLVSEGEQEPDFDTTFVVGGTVGAAAVFPITGLPRTLHHVEITLNVAPAVTTEIALLDGMIPLTLAQQQHNHAATVPSPSSAIVVSAGGNVTARDYLGGSGELTVFFPAALTAFANVRVRSLDKVQTRPIRA